MKITMGDTIIYISQQIQTDKICNFNLLFWRSERQHLTEHSAIKQSLYIRKAFFLLWFLQTNKNKVKENKWYSSFMPNTCLLMCMTAFSSSYLIIWGPVWGPLHVNIPGNLILQNNMSPLSTKLICKL